MQAIGSRLLIVLVTFGIGVASARLKDLFSEPRIRVAHQIEPLTIPHINALWPATRFKLVDRSCESGCVETYQTPDGQEVSLTYACYTGSAPDTRREVERLIKEGTVVEHQQESGRIGTTERTVLLYPQDETGKRPAEILSYIQGDTCFQNIRAGSLELALEFERSGIPGEFFTRIWND
ncbi:MAG TPA: hypothetical protein VJM12_04415 [Pyrinomonadaceae bacterium]|nr:hypothetical protein [Pyrinomonadaceae bacterium]